MYYFGQPVLVVNLREFLPDEAIPGAPTRIQMGDREAAVATECKPEYLRVGSASSKKFDDSLSITMILMARIRLARIAFSAIHQLEAAKAFFGTRRVQPPCCASKGLRRLLTSHSESLKFFRSLNCMARNAGL
jgi:hypothetical protein